MAKVCNPIYDTVFKFLMEDERVAKVLLGGILNKKIETVEIKGHECTIENPDGTIQIPFLPEKPKKPLEKMLRAFDQRYKLEYDSKYLELSEDKDKDSDFNIIFNRLLYAAADEQLRGNLDLEDYAERLFAFRKAEKEDLEYELKETKVELGEAKVELKETKNQLAASIKLLHSVGISPAQIAAQLNISIDEVNKVL